MDFKKLGQQVGQLRKQAEDKLGDRAERDNLKRDGKELRNIMSGDGSLADKAKEAKEKVIDRDKETTKGEKPAPAQGSAPAPAQGSAPAPEAGTRPKAPPGG